MSDQQPLQPPRPAISSPRRNIFVTIFLILLGGILLLPGLCSIIFGITALGSLFYQTNVSDLLAVLPIWLFGMLLGAAGLGLMIVALRR